MDVTRANLLMHYRGKKMQITVDSEKVTEDSHFQKWYENVKITDENMESVEKKNAKAKFLFIYHVLGKGPFGKKYIATRDEHGQVWNSTLEFSIEGKLYYNQRNIRLNPVVDDTCLLEEPSRTNLQTICMQHKNGHKVKCNSTNSALKELSQKICSKFSSVESEPESFSNTDQLSSNQASSSGAIATKASDPDAAADLTLISLAGKTIFNTHNGPIEVEFSAPIYLGQNVKLSPKQPKPLNVLVLNKRDLNLMDKIMTKHNTHGGAFGSDYATLSKELNQKYKLNTVLWKHPKDILFIDSFNTKSLLNLGLSVGTYSALVDTWTLSFTHDHPDISYTKDSASIQFTNGDKPATPLTKLRFDFQIGDSAHVLTTYTVAFPMISTHYYFKYHWDGDYTSKTELRQDRNKYKKVIQELYNQLEITAYSVRGEHHALVFVADKDGVMSISRFVRYLKEHSEELKRILNFKTFNSWKRNYITYNQAVFEQGKWN